MARGVTRSDLAWIEKLRHQSEKNGEVVIHDSRRILSVIGRYTQATQFCDEHLPGGGSVGSCQKCALIELSRIISRIDYELGPPNEMGVSLYDVEPDPEAVLERVKDMKRRLSTAQWSRG